MPRRVRHQHGAEARARELARRAWRRDTVVRVAVALHHDVARQQPHLSPVLYLRRRAREVVRHRELLAQVGVRQRPLQGECRPVRRHRDHGQRFGPAGDGRAPVLDGVRVAAAAGGGPVGGGDGDVVSALEPAALLHVDDAAPRNCGVRQLGPGARQLPSVQVDHTVVRSQYLRAEDRHFKALDVAVQSDGCPVLVRLVFRASRQPAFVRAVDVDAALDQNVSGLEMNVVRQPVELKRASDEQEVEATRGHVQQHVLPVRDPDGLLALLVVLPLAAAPGRVQPPPGRLGAPAVNVLVACSNRVRRCKALAAQPCQHHAPAAVEHTNLACLAGDGGAIGTHGHHVANRLLVGGEAPLDHNGHIRETVVEAAGQRGQPNATQLDGSAAGS